MRATLLVLLATLVVPPSAQAIPLTCVPGNFVCVGQDEFVWNSDEHCTDPNSYYHWTDRVQVGLLVASAAVYSQRECRNQAQQYETRWVGANVGVMLVGGVNVDWREHTEHGATTCTMSARLVLTTVPIGCVVGSPPEGALLP